MENEIKVSVCVVTYNQEKYIAECLRSLVDQETDFKFEIIVGEDCSTDNTREIVLDFQKKYPEIIKPLLHEKNVGGSNNYLETHAKAVGKYIAHMDGDDYALPGKLQIQSDFLDANSECNMVFHRMNFIDNGRHVECPNLTKRMLSYRFYRADIIELIAIGSNSSKMYRSKINAIELPSFNLVDYTANVVQINNGFAAYCSEKALGVYRRGVGISGSYAVNVAVYNSLVYFYKEYPEYKVQINASAWAWFLSNVKHGKSTKWKFFEVIVKTFSINGLFRYIVSRRFRKEFSGL